VQKRNRLILSAALFLVSGDREPWDDRSRKKKRGRRRSSRAILLVDRVTINPLSFDEVGQRIIPSSTPVAARGRGGKEGNEEGKSSRRQLRQCSVHLLDLVQFNKEVRGRKKKERRRKEKEAGRRIPADLPSLQRFETEKERLDKGPDYAKKKKEKKGKKERARHCLEQEIAILSSQIFYSAELKRGGKRGKGEKKKERGNAKRFVREKEGESETRCAFPCPTAKRFTTMNQERKEKKGKKEKEKKEKGNAVRRLAVLISIPSS